MSEFELRNPVGVVSPSRAKAGTHVRWRVMTFVTLVTVLTYLDRLNLSIAAPYVQSELGLSTEAMGWVLSAFLLGYATMQIPGGWAGDRFGARRVMTVAIFLWSLFTALTAYASGFAKFGIIGPVASLILVRFLVGVGEAASSPNLNKIVSAWMGNKEHGKGSSFTILGIGLGGALTPPLIAWAMQRYGWHSAFVAAGLAGVVIAVFWYRQVTDTPEEHPAISAEELAVIVDERVGKAAPHLRGATPWKRFLASRSVWGLVLGYACQGFPIYFYHTWFFVYLVNHRHLSISKGSFLGATPYIAIACLAPVGGFVSDLAAARLGKRNGRRVAVWLGMGLSALFLLVGSHTEATIPAVLMLACGAGLNMFAATTFWATCIDLSSECTASISGLMNTFGNLGGWLSPIVSAYIAMRFGWEKALLCAAVVTVLSGFFFSFVDASQSLDAPETARRATSS